MLKQNANEGCNSCASLAGFVLSFITCFILLVIAPLEERLVVSVDEIGEDLHDRHYIAFIEHC